MLALLPPTVSTSPLGRARAPLPARLPSVAVVSVPNPSVPAAPSETACVCRTELPPNCKVPPWTLIVPLKVFVPVRVSVLVPSFTSPRLPRLVLARLP